MRVSFSLWLAFVAGVAFVACAEVPARNPTRAAVSQVSPVPAPAATASHGYPATREALVVESLHGVEIRDPYRWLERDGDPEVARWSAAQDEFARTRLDALPLVESLRRRFSELYYVADRQPEFRRGQRHFWTERGEKQEKTVLRWKAGPRGEAKTLLDPNTWSSDGSLSLGSWSVSRSGRFVAYQVSQNAADEASLHFVEVASGRQLERDTLEGAKYSWDIGWSLDDQGVYYTWVPPLGAVPTAERPGYAELRLHRFGTDPANDPIVAPKTGDPKTFVSATTDYDDDPYLFSVVRHGWVSRDVRLLDLREPRGRFRELVVGRNANYQPFFYGKRIYVWSDEGAPRGRLFAVDPERLARESWLEIVPEHPSRALQWVRPLGRRLVLAYLEDAKTRLEIRGLDGRFERAAELPGIGTAYLEGHPDDDAATLGFTTFTEPSGLYKTSIKNGGLELSFQVKVPFDPSPYLIEQIFVRSKDGTQVPAFVVRQRDALLDGSAPLLLYGYGGFSESITPEFWSSIVPWLEHGGSAVFANLRGGGEYGERWHELGMRRNKQNVFDDFNAVAEQLIARGYTRAERLVIRGDSNGGLLVGAALTQRPELYRVALCGVPLLDMLRYHQFGAGKTWIEEYGSADDPADFRALLGYSPYHHVRPGVRYPSLLLLSADHDDRVDPMHARKFAALLQARSAGGPVLLRIERQSGHAGGDTIKSLVEQRAHGFAFALHEIGAD